MNLSEEDLRRVLSEMGRPPGWVQPPPDSGWIAQADGSYSNSRFDRLYYDPNMPTNSGRGIWLKETWRGTFPVTGGPSHGFWGDDTDP